MEAVCSSETLVSTYRSTQRYNKEAIFEVIILILCVRGHVCQPRVYRQIVRFILFRLELLSTLLALPAVGQGGRHISCTNSPDGPCHGSGRQSPASHCGGPGSRPGPSMWDLWWTKWHWDSFFSEFFGFPLSVSFHRRSPNSYHLGNA
jgi:hypothetical protein